MTAPDFAHNPDEWQWLTHPDIAPLSQRFALNAVGFWTARGWEPCDPPDEVNLALAEHPTSAEEAPEPASSPRKAKKPGASAPEGSE